MELSQLIKLPASQAAATQQLYFVVHFGVLKLTFIVLTKNPLFKFRYGNQLVVSRS